MNKKDVLKIIATYSEEEFMAYTQNLPDDDAIEFFRLVAEIAKETPQYKNDPEYRKNVEKSMESTEKFEDICAEEAVMKLKHELEEKRLFDKLDESYENLRKVLIEEIKKGDHKLMVIAEGIIKIEKEHNTFDAANWKEIAHLMK
jgi:hypothetical protein